MSSSDHISVSKTGILRLELHYAEKLPSNIKLIVYAQMDSLLEINSQRQAFMDYAA